MLLIDIYLRDTKVVLKDVDNSDIELTAHDAWQFHLWVQKHKTLLLEAIRVEDERKRHGCTNNSTPE